jgi:hypothetical protein
MFKSAAKSDLIYGAIYRLNTEHKSELDRFEGNGHGYIDKLIMLTHNGDEYSCFTYLARRSHIVDNLKPYHWYKKLVILGAQYLQLPETYISSIATVESMEDPDQTRKKETEALIGKIINYG